MILKMTLITLPGQATLLMDLLLMIERLGEISQDQHVLSGGGGQTYLFLPSGSGDGVVEDGDRTGEYS